MKLKALRISIVVAIITALSACAWWQKHESQFKCAGIASVDNAGELWRIVTTCATIAEPVNILPCITGAVGSKWASDVVACFIGTAAGLARCPAAEAVAPKMLPSVNTQSKLREAAREANYQFTP